MALHVIHGTGKWVDIDWTETELDIIPEGTPFGADGKIHNDKYAIGFLSEPCERCWQNSVVVYTNGIVDKDELEAACGLTLSCDAISAMPNIVFMKGDRVLPRPACAG